MTDVPNVPRARPPRRPVHPVVLGLAGLMVLSEATLSLADAGYLPPIFSRWIVYSAFGFFDQVFEIARRTGEVHAQLLWSLLTHAFLHAGWVHLGLNGAAFLGLGHMVSRTAGIGAFLILFVVTAAAGALTFALISDFQGPLVGASGVVFGLIGAVTAWQEAMLRRVGASRRPIWGRIAGLVLINAALSLGTFGLVAWEAHLGGFVAGWLVATQLRPHGPPLGLQVPETLSPRLRPPWSG